ncbi:sugar transferase [Candidatus Woesearchaeota archaeon]|nr:sugar transferase [Candidatus Woesearchaeota archaeon]
MKIYHIIKRIFDIILSLIGIIILMPVFIILAVWIKFSSKGPVIYKHERIGKNGKEFNIYKFRSMVVGARDMHNKGIGYDKLITSAGRFMRKTFLDETAQLFNILKGDMGLVGPRPLDKEFYESWFKKNKHVNDIIKIKPGLTSIESVTDYLKQDEKIKFEKNFKGLLKRDTDRKHFLKHRMVLDSYYVEKESFCLDIKIICYTFILMLRKIFSKK